MKLNEMLFMLYKPWDLQPPGGVTASEEVHSDDAEIQRYRV